MKWIKGIKTLLKLNRSKLHCCIIRKKKNHSTPTEVTGHVCLSLEPGKTWQLSRRNVDLLARSEGKTDKGFLQAHRKYGINRKYWLGSETDSRLRETVR